MGLLPKSRKTLENRFQVPKDGWLWAGQALDPPRWELSRQVLYRGPVLSDPAHLKTLPTGTSVLRRVYLVRFPQELQ
jgi:hypothetical protein